jgi:hypothetical protein
MKFNSIMQGEYPANEIDAFAVAGVSWTNPLGWASPDGTTPNANTGWIGANTTDTRVNGWGSADQLFGPVSTTSHPVMAATGADTGTTVYVTYGIEVNLLQPTDLYVGSLLYNIIPTY